MKYFETIKCNDFEVFNLDFHKKRISNTVGLNINLEEYIYPVNAKLLKCKVIYDDSGILEVMYDQYIKRDIRSFILVYDDNIIYNKKCLNRDIIDKLFHQKQDYDEIIIIKNGFVTDTSIANIAIYLDNEWITPSKPLLEGTTKMRLLEDSLLKEKDITVDMLRKCTKFATLNAMVGFNIIEEFKIKE